VLNLVPARLTAALLMICGRSARIDLLQADAPRHLSPNAGWPEMAMALCLGLRLGGPRIYQGRQIDGVMLNHEGRDNASANDITHALRLLITALILSAILCFGLAYLTGYFAG
jgi:adenosylcobinamide-phosphate synthase